MNPSPAYGEVFTRGGPNVDPHTYECLDGYQQDTTMNTDEEYSFPQKPLPSEKQ